MNEEVQAIRDGAAVVRRDDLYTLRVAGPDRERFLNGMITSDVSKLEPGRMQRAIKPNNRGRVEGLLRVRADGDAYLIDVVEASAQRVATELGKLIIMDDVTLSDSTDTREIVAVYGAKARQVIRAAGWAIPDLEDLGEVELGDVRVLRDDGVAGVESYELHAKPRQGDDTIKKLIVAGAIEVDEDSIDIVRIESGVVRDGVDVDDDTIPLEANLVDWISFTKGCYVGQEVIARAHNLGGVKHRLVGLVVEGEGVPPKDAKIVVGDDESGEITSAVRSPTLGQIVALGYVHTKHEAPGTKVELTWSDRKTGATVAALPFTR